jgi:ketosteroid isomerase-like protein
MLSQKTVVVSIPLAIVMSMGLPMTARSADAVAAQAKAEVAEALHRLEGAFEDGANGAKLAELLYADDVLMVGEGEPGSSRGIKTAASDTDDWIKSLGGPNGEKSCKYTIEEPVVASRTTFTSFLLLTCKANPPALPQDQVLRMVYAWRKTAKGWRVELEMWAPGRF